MDRVKVMEEQLQKAEEEATQHRKNLERMKTTIDIKEDDSVISDHKKV